MSGVEFDAPQHAPEAPKPTKRARPEPSRLLIQPKLIVGDADDALEREAALVARRVLARWADADDPSPTRVQTAGPIVSRAAGAASGHPGGHASSAGGRGGGEVESATEQAVRSALGAGRPLAPTLLRRYERAFGAEFSHVRVHDDSRSAQFNRQFGARAFTVGSDIFLGAGAPALDSQPGVELMSHELTHTMQQGSQARRVQRDIGFEFETKGLETKKTADDAGLPVAGFATAVAGKAAFDAGVRVAKGVALLKRGDLEVQADDWGAKSDMEVVITHLPETNAGRQRLVAAITDLHALMQAYTALAAAGGDYVPAEALNGAANFNQPLAGGMFKGNWATASTMPQVTMGLRVGNIVDLVQDLQGSAFAPQTKQQAKAGAPRVSNESAQEKAARDAGRRRFRGDKLDPADQNPNPAQRRKLNEVKDLSEGNEAHTLVLGLTLAKESVLKYRAKHNAAPGGKDLEGFLTLVFAYAEGGRRKGGFLKSHTPLMAKTDMVTIWDQLPLNVRTYYGEQVTSGNTRLEELIATASGYSGRLDQPLVLVQGLADENMNDQGGFLPQHQLDWYQSLIMRDWVRSICITQQRTKWQKFREVLAGTQDRQRKDKLTTAHFPNLPGGKVIEGYAALGNRMDADATNPATPLPVFELRSGSRPVQFANLQQWATDVFDYITALNAAPNGPHPLIAGAPPA